MISKISYIKLIREDIRHRGWLAALSGVLLFLSMPVYTLIYLDSYSEDPEVLKEFADTFSGFISFPRISFGWGSNSSSESKENKENCPSISAFASRMAGEETVISAV